MTVKGAGAEIRYAAVALATALIVVWVLFPLYAMVKISVSPAGEVMTEHPSLVTFHPTLAHWRDVIRSGNLRQPLGKSFSVAAIASLITLAIAIPGAYGIARLPRKWAYICLAAIFLTRAFPEVCIALPISIRFVRWSLIDTDIGLALAHVLRVLPVACWILVGAFRTIPAELEEQAAIDGCSRWGALGRVVLPLSLGALAVAAIFSWLFSWDEFTYALYLCLAEPTLPLKVYYYINRGNWFMTATYATVITVPVVIVTYSLQRFLRAGYTSGAIKE